MIFYFIINSVSKPRKKRFSLCKRPICAGAEQPEPPDVFAGDEQPEPPDVCAGAEQAEPPGVCAGLWAFAFASFIFFFMRSIC